MKKSLLQLKDYMGLENMQENFVKAGAHVDSLCIISLMVQGSQFKYVIISNLLLAQIW